MPMPANRRTDASTSARHTTDAATARRIVDLVAESFDPFLAVAGASEDGPDRWTVAIHFRDPPNETAVRALVALAAGPDAANALAFETIAPKDWVKASLAGLTPVEAGRFVVHGAHDRARIARNRIGIEIEAGLAFGTGHHGTTRGCLLALDRIVKQARNRPRTVLDLGTGTGVLAIAAARALRRRIVASDIDPVAVATAAANARLNGAGPSIEFVHAAGLGARNLRRHAPYDLVLANILLAPLQRLATPIARIIAPNGRVVLSGLLRAQASAALAAYRTQGLTLERSIPLDDWVTLVLRR
jgi:ribosomal protein L11 methyltransferase